MNQITQLLRQLQAMFAGMNPQSRLLAVLMLVAILISSAFLIQGVPGSTVATEYIFDGRSFNEDELDRMELAFGSSGLKNFERVGARLRVPKASRGEYLKAISDAKAMPVALGNSMEQSFNSSNLLETSQMTSMRHQNSRIKELQASLRTIPFVREALINFDEKSEGFTGEKRKTASIAIYPKNGVELNESQKHSIISYVEKAFAGLKRSDIALMDMSRSETYMISDDPEREINDQYLRTKAYHERRYWQKANDLLAPYGDVRIQVNVELDPTLSEETHELKYDNKATMVSTNTTKKDADSKKSSPGGRPGAEQAIVSSAMQPASLADQSSKSKEQSDVGRGVVGNKLTSSKRAGLKPTGATFSVSLPISYYRKAQLTKWQMQNPGQDPSKAPALTESELSTIKTETVSIIRQKLTPILDKGSPGEDIFPRVEVTEHPDVPELKIEEPSMTAQTLQWLSQSWQTLALFGLAAAALGSLRSFSKAGSGGNDEPFERGFDIPLDDAADIDLSGLNDEDTPGSGEERDAESPPSFKTTGGDLKQDLTTLVRSNPDAAATLLRSWISDDVE